MSKGLRVSDVLSSQEIMKFGRQTVISAGVGSGKNWWVTNVLKNLGRILLITSRKLTMDQTNMDYPDFIKSVKFRADENGYAVVTNSQFEFYVRICGEPQNFLRGVDGTCVFDYIVVDEAHSLFTDSTFTYSSFYLWVFIQQIIKHEAFTKVILMSATLMPFLSKLQKAKWKHIDLREKCISIVPDKINVMSTPLALWDIITHTSRDNKMIYMATSATDIANNLLPLFGRLGIRKDRIAVIMNESKMNELFPVEIKKQKGVTDKEQIHYLDDLYEKYKAEECYKKIKESGELPENIDILLATSRLREGVNITDVNVKRVYIESHNKIDIIQFAGRARKGVECLTVIDSKHQHDNGYYKLEWDYSISETENANRYLEKLVENEFLYDCTRINYLNIPGIKVFIDYIENVKQFEFIKFNPFTRHFEQYEMKKFGYDLNHRYLQEYRENSEDYIYWIYKKQPMMAVEDENFIVNSVIKNRKLVGKIIDSYDRDKLLEFFTIFGICTKRKSYKKLGNLLLAFGYRLIPVKGNNGKFMIIPKDKSTSLHGAIDDLPKK